MPIYFIERFVIEINYPIIHYLYRVYNLYNKQRKNLSVLKQVLCKLKYLYFLTFIP